MLTTPSSGVLYFPADTLDDLDTATLLGTYSVRSVLFHDGFESGDTLEWSARQL